MLGRRLRQVALVAHDLGPVVDALGAVLEFSEEPFVDPGVGVFGLRNAVLSVGDTFIEVVSPVRPDTAARRYLDRRGGDCGYVAIFQVEDLASARAWIADLGIRTVWQSDHIDMAGTHLHPKMSPGHSCRSTGPLRPARGDGAVRSGPARCPTLGRAELSA